MPQTEGLLESLSAAAKPGETWPLLVLAALEGEEQLESALGHPEERPSSEKPEGAAPPRPHVAYLKSITVEGFRGIGKSTTLDLAPGPGLTLVVGRNGSGKSSFAEALELLLTGETYRFKQRAKVWREGWRSLHHKPAAIQAELHIEGETGPATVARHWPDDADLAGGATTFQVKGKPRTDLASLGWANPLEAYRPFLSYNELGSMLDDAPSKLCDALSGILGQSDLVAAQDVLKEARAFRAKEVKEVGELRKQILAALGTIEDERANAVTTTLEKMVELLASVADTACQLGGAKGGQRRTKARFLPSHCVGAFGALELPTIELAVPEGGPADAPEKCPIPAGHKSRHR